MQPISRRTFLRGSGACLGLPLLSAMMPARLRADDLVASATATGARPPVRMACIYFPNGVWEREWVPKRDGADYELTWSLEPLKEHKSELLVLSRLDKKNSHTGDGHYAKTANFLTGLPVMKTAGSNLSVGGMSIDQLCAERIGHLTPLPSLELAIDPVASGVDGVVGYTRLYASYISWRSASMPMAREINPRFVYERLFGSRGGAAADARARQDNRLLLDLVLEDAGDLSRRLGRDDRTKLDEYLESVRAVEKRIAAHEAPVERSWHPLTQPEPFPVPHATAPASFPDHIRLMLDLMVLAFWTDSTRISTFMFANDVSGRNFGSVIEGTNGAHHEFSHHTGAAEKIDAYKKINRWHSAQLAYLLDRMRSIHEGNGTLLDNSMVMFGSSISDGDRHNPSNLPIILAGRGGHTINTGRHLVSPHETPLCNLYASMLDRMGTPVERFGDSTGKLLD
ncbi:MAG TPA: DUF1552 domain-containing protein [Pirellulales bacterium]|nr:DUF1552 domain-containing protein [Pirellulales bacterium]